MFSARRAKPVTRAKMTTQAIRRGDVNAAREGLFLVLPMNACRRTAVAVRAFALDRVRRRAGCRPGRSTCAGSYTFRRAAAIPSGARAKVPSGWAGIKKGKRPDQAVSARRLNVEESG